MGLFSSSKKIYTRDFKKSLRKGLGLSRKQRIYTEKAFGKELKGGLSEFEIKKRCRQLRYKPGDPLRSHKVARIKEKLLKRFK